MSKRQFLSLELQKDNLLHRLSQLKHEQLIYQETENTWSIYHVLDHLIKIEEMAVMFVESKLAQPKKLRSLTWKSYYRYWLLIFALRSKLKFKAPLTVAPAVDEKAALNAYFERWQLAREKLSELMNVAPSKLKLGVFKHPVVGYLNFYQMMGFLQAHFNHHLVQINNLLSTKKS